jgi:hypothetical protein
MTKNELLDAIRLSGADVKIRVSKDELQEIYDGLHVHQKPEPEPEPVIEPKKKPVPEPEPEPEPEPVPEPEPEPEPEPVPEPAVDSFDDLLGKIKGADIPHSTAKPEKPLIEKTRKKRTKKESSPDSTRIEGYVLLIIVDTIFPLGMAWVNNMLNKKKRVEADQLRLAQKDFDKLEPLADQAADYMSININPIAGFFLVASFMYANNLIAIQLGIKTD